MRTTTKWKAGCFRQNMDGEPKVFIEKDGKRKEKQVEARIEEGRKRDWF